MSRARWHTVLVAVAVLVPGVARAQSSQFGVRGLGLIGRTGSAHAVALGGSLALFDGESGYNPAALSSLSGVTSLITSTQTWRESSNPTGAFHTRDSRFPHLLIGGPVRGARLAFGVSYSLYADRDFTIASVDTASPRGIPVTVIDTLSSRGGVNDLQAGFAWGPRSNFAVGASVHFLTGVNRLSTRRIWSDTVYLAPQEKAELSYQGVGVGVGFLWRPIPGLDVAAMVRRDGTLDVQRDTVASSAKIGLPTTMAAGLRYSAGRQLTLSVQGSRSSWSRADSGLREQGSPGSKDSYDLSAGVEYFRNSKRPGNLPLRVGVFRSTLPFLLVTGAQPTATGLSFGTGMKFAGDRGGFDLALERVTRSQGSLYRETAWQVSFGITVRAGGFTP